MSCLLFGLWAVLLYVPLLCALQKCLVSLRPGICLCLRAGCCQVSAGGWTDGCMVDGQLDVHASHCSCWVPPVGASMLLAWGWGHSGAQAWPASPLLPYPGPQGGGPLSVHPLPFLRADVPPGCDLPYITFPLFPIGLGGPLVVTSMPQPMLSPLRGEGHAGGGLGLAPCGPWWSGLERLGPLKCPCSADTMRVSPIKALGVGM